MNLDSPCERLRWHDLHVGSGIGVDVARRSVLVDLVDARQTVLMLRVQETAGCQ